MKGLKLEIDNCRLGIPLPRYLYQFVSVLCVSVWTDLCGTIQ